ncbi:uncharacterized protein LOC126746833 [Anthonomus grandis grandis]|uniref:uncharacterized protein LOC126746833 n=1 Tax=Anthonomus grandis grandis TaxID=2921223 RepID=UPI0021655590|nr:uncharacterized protein LOC126746833 [Anthonomus grandis grandis]
MASVPYWGLTLLLMGLFGKGDAVKCFVCSTQVNETACKYPESYNLPVRKCDLTALEKTREFARGIDERYNKIFEVDVPTIDKNIDLDCLKVVTQVGNKIYTFRGCQLAEQSSLDICQKMQKADTDYMKKVYCSRCGKDRCNSAPTTHKYHIPVVVVLPVLFKGLL